MDNSEEGDRWGQLFGQLDNWRNLPTYQLERRAEIFFSFYLPEILSLNKSDIKFIIPEFPLPLAIVDETGKGQSSSKVDYLVATADRILFVEIKTDVTSVEGEKVACSIDGKTDMLGLQLCRMLKAQRAENGMHAILKMIGQINIKHRIHKAKWKYLLQFLATQKVDWLSPSTTGKGFVPAHDHYPKIEIIYIQPSQTSPEEKFGIRVIDFHQVIRSIDHHLDPFTQRFIESLVKWKKEPGPVLKQILSVPIQKSPPWQTPYQMAAEAAPTSPVSPISS